MFIPVFDVPPRLLVFASPAKDKEKYSFDTSVPVAKSAKKMPSTLKKWIFDNLMPTLFYFAFSLNAFNILTCFKTFHEQHAFYSTFVDLIAATPWDGTTPQESLKDPLNF